VFPIESPHDLLGHYVPVQVTGCTPNSLLGEHATAL